MEEMDWHIDRAQIESPRLCVQAEVTEESRSAVRCRRLDVVGSDLREFRSTRDHDVGVGQACRWKSLT